MQTRRLAQEMYDWLDADIRALGARCVCVSGGGVVGWSIGGLGWVGNADVDLLYTHVGARRQGDHAAGAAGGGGHGGDGPHGGGDPAEDAEAGMYGCCFFWDGLGGIGGLLGGLIGSTFSAFHHVQQQKEKEKVKVISKKVRRYALVDRRTTIESSVYA